MLTKLKTLLEQTSFLLEKQREAKDECHTIFTDFLELIDEKKQDCVDPEDLKSLEKIYTMVQEQATCFRDETQEDIDFLDEQLKMLSQVETMTDTEKAQELFSTIVDENEEILETEEFKQGVLDDSDISKKNLINMIDDIKNALQENSIKEVELLLESLALESCDEDCDEECCDTECDVECDDEYEDDCGSECRGCNRSCGGVDIFDEFDEYKE